MEEVFGFVETVVYAQEFNGFTVAKLKEPRKEELTCIVGIMPGLQPGESIQCRGTWKHHPQYGQQFDVQSFDLQSPSDLIGIQKYLESGMIKGIGKSYAERIVKQFGLDTLKVIDETPDRLIEVSGLGAKRIDKIKSCWSEQQVIRKVMIFLRGHGVSPGFAQKIFKAYGEKSIEKVQANPYLLAKEIHGIGFKSADQIAQGIGISAQAPERIDAGIEHVLWEMSNDGNVCVPKEELLKEAPELLQVDMALIEERIKAQVKAGNVIEDGEMVWVKPLYLCESGIVRELHRIMEGYSPLRGVDQERAILWVQEELGIELAPEQKSAVCEGIAKKLLIITGGPGTGKSTITKAILRITAKLTSEIILAAPTGRAAKRLTEITGKKASTIHSLLEMDFQSGGFKRNKQNPIKADLLIVDEASMIDTQLMYHLLKAIPATTRLIFVGDIDQLPSVGPGNVLKDMIDSKRLPVITLKQIFRQAAGSQIITNAHLINQGEFPDLKRHQGSDFLYIERETPDEILATILDLVTVRLPRAYRFHKFLDIQVLSPMKRGIVGIENLNMVLQKTLNPSPHPLERMGRRFHIGDKVMQIRNNYEKEVYNGDIGTITEIDLDDGSLKVAFDDKSVPYDLADVDELLLAYAASVHKYQGSECPCIILPIHTSHFKLLTRNLLYTAVTRGKKLVILIGTKKAIGIAINNQDVHKRHTGLKQMLTREIVER
jgi:exodeoxyribonuclease V alpha subunit